MRNPRLFTKIKKFFEVPKVQRILRIREFFAIYRSLIMICIDIRSDAESFISKCICIQTGDARGLTTAKRHIFRLSRILESEGAVGTRLCRWDKLTTGPRRWDTTWIIRPSTHNCIALSGRAGSFESWYLQRARFRRNRAEVRKKRRVTVTFAVSHADKTRYICCICYK